MQPEYGMPSGMNAIEARFSFTESRLLALVYMQQKGPFIMVVRRVQVVHD
jgi:hypothetical protein